MEKHHKLRRPAGSSIHGCNICGIEGHQAAQCPNGTVNWAQKWGPNAFQSTGPAGGGLSSGTTTTKEPDYADLAAQARAFAAKRLADEEAAKKKAEEVRATYGSARTIPPLYEPSSRSWNPPFPFPCFFFFLFFPILVNVRSSRPKYTVQLYGKPTVQYSSFFHKVSRHLYQSMQIHLISLSDVSCLVLVLSCSVAA